MAHDEHSDLLVCNGTIISMDSDRRILKNACIAIKDGLIHDLLVHADHLPMHAQQTIDASGKLLIPGLINTHAHAPMGLLRGLADDFTTDVWLNQYIWPAEQKFANEEFVYWGTQLGCLEMLESGITTFADMYFFEDALARAVELSGMRGILAQTVIDYPTPDNQVSQDKVWDRGLKLAIDFVDTWQGHDLITPAIAPHAPNNVAPDHFKEAYQEACRKNTPFLTHVAEIKKEAQQIRDQYEIDLVSPIQYLAELGVLDNRMLAAHAIWVDDADIKLMQQAGVGVAHCPESNMKLASGIAPVPQMLKQGLAVGLGTDGAASNNTLDLWQTMDITAKLHKVSTLDPCVLPARQAFEMATIEGARAMHMDHKIGSIEAGKCADIVLLDTQSTHQMPAYDYYSQLVYTTKACDVETVIVNGKVVLQQGQCLTLDTQQVLSKAEKYRIKITETVLNR